MILTVRTGSGFLTDLKTAYTHYDIEDYRNDKNCHDLSDDIILERLVLEDLLSDDMQLDRKKIAKHIYGHRKTISREAIASFYIYAEVTPEITRLLHVLGENNSKSNVKEEISTVSVVEGDQGNNGIVFQNITFNGDLVVTKHVGNEVNGVAAGATGVIVNKEEK